MNTAIPYEKQIFAAAHVWGIAGDRSEVLQGKDVPRYTVYLKEKHDNFADKTEDMAK